MGVVDTTAERSRLMKNVRREGTSAEIVVRRFLWGIGGRYRTNVRGLPGSPDIVNKSRQKAIFVNGCFWHWHEDCERGSIPESNREFWQEKLQANRDRDERKRKRLVDDGYDVLVVWECELEDPECLVDRLESFWFQSNGEESSRTELT